MWQVYNGVVPSSSCEGCLPSPNERITGYVPEEDGHGSFFYIRAKRHSLLYTERRAAIFGRPQIDRFDAEVRKGLDILVFIYPDVQGPI